MAGSILPGARRRERKADARIVVTRTFHGQPTGRKIETYHRYHFLFSDVAQGKSGGLIVLERWFQEARARWTGMAAEELGGTHVDRRGSKVVKCVTLRP